MYYAYAQEHGESKAKHLRNFKSIVSAIEHLCGTMFSDDGLFKIEKRKDEDAGRSTRDDDYYRSVVRGKMHAVVFLKRSCCDKIMTSIFDQHSFKKDVYSKTLHKSYKLLENHNSAATNRTKSPRSRYPSRSGGRRQHIGGKIEGRFSRGNRNEQGRDHIRGMQMAQTTDIVPGVDGRRIGHIQCFICKKYGHYSDQC